MVAHQPDQMVGVAIVEPHPWTDRRDELLAALGVITRVALADVVQKRTDHEKIGTGDSIGEQRRLYGGLPQVSIDREAVVGVSLRAGTDRRPLGQHARQ